MEKNQDSSSGKEEACRQTTVNNRLFVEAVLYRYCVGILWQKLPEGYRDWKTSIDVSAVGPAE